MKKSVEDRPNNQTHPLTKMDKDNISLHDTYKNISQCQKETITDKENIFTVEGLLISIINDLTEQDKTINSIQKAIATLIPIVRQIVREELTRLRGFQ